MRVLSLLGNIVPYHHFRWDAFARLGGNSTTILEIVSGDDFGVLEYQNSDASYRRETLFHDRSPKTIPVKELKTKLTKALTTISPEVVFLNGYSFRFNWIALHWCLTHGVPAVVCSESNEFDELRKPWKEAIKRFFVTRCVAGVAGGTPQGAYLVKLGLQTGSVFSGYDVVENSHFAQGSDQARAQPEETRRKLGLPHRYFFACARFGKKKNLPGLIRAYARYRKLIMPSRVPNPSAFDLVIAGEGEERAEIERTIRGCGVEDHVHLVGPKGYDDLSAYYGLAEAFIHASTTEQWGLVVNEAMASGLPVLVSNRCGCAADLVKEGFNGWTFDPTSEEQLAELMMGIASDEAARSKMGVRSREIIAKWGPDRFASGVSDAVRTALAAPRNRCGLIDRLILGLMVNR